MGVNILSLGLAFLGLVSDPWFLAVLGLTLLTLAGYAALGLNSEIEHRRIERWLRVHPDEARLYRRIIHGILERLSRAVRPEVLESEPPGSGLWQRLSRWTAFAAPTDAAAHATARNPWDWPILDFALRIALAYPFLLLFVQWLWLGETVRFGGVSIFEAAPAIDRMIAFLAIGLFVSTLFVSQLTTTKPWLRLLILLIAAIVAGQLAGTYLNAGPIAAACIGLFVSGVYAISLIISYVVGYSLILQVIYEHPTFSVPLLLVAGFVAWTCGGLVARIPAPLVQREFGLLGYGVLLIILVAALVPSVNLLSGSANDYQKSVLLFLAIFPLVNALFDYISYALTLTLISRGVRRDSEGRKPGWRAFLYGVADVIIALGLFTALGATLTAIVALLNQHIGPDFYPLAPVFEGVRKFDTEYFWLVGMIFSTFVPTVAHLLLASISLVAAVPKAWREGIWALYTAPADDYLKRSGGVVLIGALGTAVAMLPLMVGSALAWAIVSHYEVIGTGYLRIFEEVARALGEPL